MTLRAQNRLLDRLGRYPSAVELYREQWPDDQVQFPQQIQQALDATANVGGATQLDYASLVDLKTGEVVWFNVVQAGSQIPGSTSDCSSIMCPPR